jgi:hypothetical protein
MICRFHLEPVEAGGVPAIIFSARKAEAQSFVTVEDFWGGLLIGFLIGYSGTTIFAKITGS